MFVCSVLSYLEASIRDYLVVSDKWVHILKWFMPSQTSLGMSLRKLSLLNDIFQNLGRSGPSHIKSNWYGLSNHTKTSFPSKTHCNTSLLFRYEGQRQASNSLILPRNNITEKLLVGHFHMVLLVYGRATTVSCLPGIPGQLHACTHSVHQALFGAMYTYKTR